MPLLKRIRHAHRIWRQRRVLGGWVLCRLRAVRNWPVSVRGLGWLAPHLLTCLGVCCGFASLIHAGAHDWSAAASYIFAAAWFDMIDGRVARALGVCSAFGVQLDSLADAVSFCIAPAYLVYQWCSGGPHSVGLVAALVFALAGLLRLARFNVTHTQQYVRFIGLPTTAAALIVASCMMVLSYNGRHPEMCLALLLIVLGCLMVSTLRVPTFKALRPLSRRFR